MSEPNRYWTYFDEAWKKVIERFFPQFLYFFVPALYEDVDFSKPFTFLDKELEQMSQKSIRGSKFVDKLAKVFLKDGNEQWILIHIEIQADTDDDFSLRMFRYFYRIFDQHGERIVSMAVLAGSENRAVKGRYELKAYGSGIEFQYLTFKLIDYERDKLEAEDNPIALVILAAQERERLRRSQDRFNTKWYLIRKLYERGYSRAEITGLFEFIDWVLQLSDTEEKRLWEQVKALEEVRRMPYVTSGERIGMEKGLQQGLQQMVLEAVEERFGEIPTFISDVVHQIEDHDQLRSLLRQAIRSVSLEAFQQGLNGN
ncbi:MAG: transposase [Candidatus Poribacteria bacterium]|nr:transposase [Candidatus Poribacteria bacterium]